MKLLAVTEHFPVKGGKSVTGFVQLDFKPKFKYFKYC